MIHRKDAAKEFIKIMDDTKPNSAAREFWIDDILNVDRPHMRSAYIYEQDTEKCIGNAIHVVEHSAFLKQQKIIEVLRAALKNTIYDSERLKQGEYAVEAVNNALAEADRIEKGNE